MTGSSKKPRNPDAEIIPILRRINGMKKARAFFMRRTTANLMERLDAEEQDAMVAIARAHLVICGTLGMKQWRYGELLRIPKTDLSDYALDLVTHFRDWSAQLVRNNPDALGLCISVCTDEESLKQLTKYRRMRWENLFNLFREGLREWIAVEK